MCGQAYQWHCSSDIDDESLEYAERNIAINQLDNRVAALKVQRDAPFFAAALHAVPQSVACMMPHKRVTDRVETLSDSTFPCAIRPSTRRLKR